MASDTSIVNYGLRLIGGQPIISLTDGSNSANAANNIYEDLRDDLLRSHPWNFATKRQKLAQSSTDPTFEFDHAYPLPSDWLRTVSVHADDIGVSTILYKEEQVGNQKVLVTSHDEVWLRYIARVTDPNMMSADFRMALSVALARDLAVPIASSNTLADKFEKRAERVLARARSADGMGSFPERRPRGSWVNSRGGWRRSMAEGE